MSSPRSRKATKRGASSNQNSAAKSTHESEVCFRLRVSVPKLGGYTDKYLTIRDVSSLQQEITRFGLLAESLEPQLYAKLTIERFQ